MIKCDMCEREFPEYNGGVPDRGLEIIFSGGYGLFHDDIDNRCIKSIVACHDCVLKVIRMIPKFANEKGWHSVSEWDECEPLCCEYSWTQDDITGETVYGTKENYKERQGD